MSAVGRVSELLHRTATRIPAKLRLLNKIRDLETEQDRQLHFMDLFVHKVLSDLKIEALDWWLVLANKKIARLKAELGRCPAA